MTLDSKSYGIKYNNRHSSDFDLKVLNTKVIGMPAKKKVTINLPYSNNIVDLSSIYGKTKFSERVLEVDLRAENHSTQNKELLYHRWTEIINWLMEPDGKTILVDDVMSNYYYLAEVADAPTWEEYANSGDIKIKFNCYPFRIHAELEGNDIWDIFDFDLDVAQETKMSVTGSKTIMQINDGAAEIQPTIVCDADFTVTLGGYTYQLTAGTFDSENAAYPLTLAVGENLITITGTGHIEFKWHKELI